MRKPPLIALVCALATLVALSGLTSCGEATSKIVVSNAVTPVPPTPDQAVVYLTIENSGDADDELNGVLTDRAVMSHLHSNKITADGKSTMDQTNVVKIPAGGKVQLAAGSMHIMLMEPKPLKDGETFKLTLSFLKAGSKTVTVRVVRPDQVPLGTKS